jgi:hypothetical protein
MTIAAGATDGSLATYDVTGRLVFIGASDLARLYVNDEVVGLVDVSGVTAVGVHTSFVDSGGVFTAATLAKAFLLNARTFLPVITTPSSTVVGTEYRWAVPKVPYQMRSTAADASSGIGLPDLLLAYREDVAPTVPITLVLKVVSTTTSPDQFAWQVAGDTVFQAARTFTATGVANTLVATVSGSPPAAEDCLTSSDRCLTARNTYLAATNPDDPQRQQLGQVVLTWDAADADYRGVCTSAQSYWYIQLGSVGVNDSPECSDRGLCDYSSGTCKCFKGYAGIDCSMQNALATGGSGGVSGA